MLLSDLLPALSVNAELKITIIDGSNPVITFTAAGYSAINDDLAARTVSNIRIEDAKDVSIFLVPIDSGEPTDENP